MHTESVQVMRQHSTAARIVDAFHSLYYDSLAWDQNSFLGYQIKQCPLDLQVYQELLTIVRPPSVIQTGVAQGGSLLFFASMMDLLGMEQNCIVVGVDLQLSRAARSLTHSRIHLVEGNSVARETVQQVDSLLNGRRGLVSLDSNHTFEHVLAELLAYRQFVEVGSYLVVEDTNINGHPVLPHFGAGPLEAVNTFLRQEERFARDDNVWRRNLFSFHQFGWLRREC